MATSVGRPANAAERLLESGLARTPGKAALIFDGSVTNYEQLARQAMAFGNLIKTKGIVPGDRVAILLPDCPAFVQTFLGAMLAGAVPVPMSPAAPREQLEFILGDSGARALVVEQGRTAISPFSGFTIQCGLAGVDARLDGSGFSPHVPAHDDLAFMLYTSGSTGKPKGVPHRHADLGVPLEAWGRPVLGITSDDVLLSASKLSFSYGLQMQLAVGLAAGATIVLHSGLSDGDSLLALMTEVRPTIFCAVPSVYALLTRTLFEPCDLSPLRLCVSSGEAMPAALHEAWRGLTGLEVVEGFGSTETFTTCMSNRSGHNRPGTMGTPVPGFDARIVDEQGREVAPGAEGRLQIRGPGIMLYYWNRPDSTAKSLLLGGWLDTGDRCVRASDGYRHLGRSDDLIRSGGQWVSPFPVEICLREHPAVADCAVAACRIQGLEYPGAFVVLRSQHPPHAELAGELRRHMAGRLPRHMCPVRVAFVEELPRTVTGKVQRHRLRQ
ncbi:acyl-CoA synthetase (AMP-forming)/AMP-acid ligase II [Desulfocurvibacter africanus PCS]|uniref:Acyl-CoA synthetase (AMP-forming)/AMP-acid ligase II n=1 Tax=Desulfocurvibacter africanus PCS TaxID=1262666 RepID=M5PU56_DESAF|nr:AMP-binding protein [Desulfocurvibacter africanus]EMG37877.1 acyl-CoA synthetase (AMP-forming)/AMP-acid ligase II [Desulfocurvibacter africanus PCS]